MDRLSEYVIKHSSCAMPRCEYVENGIEIDCDKCQEIMMQEHDAKIRADAIDECIKVMRYCWFNGQQPLNVLVSRLESLKE